jgi:hypothetical protein
MSRIVPVLILGLMVILFIGTYAWNKRTPAPKIEGMDFEACSTCKIATCAYHGGDKK